MISRGETAVLVVGLAVIATSGFLFVRESAQGDSKVQPIGRITFRYRVAQRRASDRVVWDDVRPGSVLYDNNFVRTDSGSEAIVELDNGTRIELDPDSMIVLQKARGGTSIDFQRGSVSVNSAGRGGMHLTAGGRLLRFDSGQARVTHVGGGLEVTTVRGRVLLEQNGKDLELAPGSGHRLEAKGVSSRPVLLGQALPEDSHRFFTNEGTARVEFSWDGPLGQLEVARDRRFAIGRRLLVAKERRATLDLADGIFYWRTRTGNRVSEERKLRVVRLPPLLLQRPQADAVLETPASRRAVWFSWDVHSLADGYRLQIASDSTFSRVISERALHSNGGSLALRAGTYHWRVVTVPTLPGSEVTSSVRRLSVEQRATVRPPKLLGPASPYALLPGEQSPAFSWISDDPAAASELVVARDAAFTDIVLRSPAAGGRFRPSASLPAGRLFWRIIDRYEGRKGEFSSEAKVVEVTAGALPSSAAAGKAEAAGPSPNTALPNRERADKTGPVLTERTQSVVQDTGPLAAPKLVFPKPNSAVDMTTRDSITFRWTTSVGAIGYRLQLRRAGRALFEARTETPSLRFSDLSKLDTGEFEVEIEALAAEPARSTKSTHRFRITLSETLEKPELDIKR